MGLLDFFKKNSEVVVDNVESNGENNLEKIIDRNLFVKEPEKNAEDVVVKQLTSWERIFQKIRKDYETEGYNDALSTSDNKYRNDNAEILKLNLSVDIKEAEVEIKEYLNELEFHINSRQKAGLVDLVEELESKKTVYIERLEILAGLKNDIKENTGIPQRMVLAYNRGFNKGMAALTVAQVINKNI